MKAKRETDPKINTDNTAVDLKKESKKQPEIKKISDLHLAKLQDAIKKENQINQSISELFYKKVHIEQLEFELKTKTQNVMSEKSELFQEITNVYGVVNINPETGEITEISN